MHEIENILKNHAGLLLVTLKGGRRPETGFLDGEANDRGNVVIDEEEDE